MTKKEKRNIHLEVTTALVSSIEALPEDDINWMRSWGLVNTRPVSKATGKPYNGINWFILSIMQQLHGYASNEWGTFNYWFKAGGGEREGKTVTKESRYSVKGQKGTQVVLYKPRLKTEKDKTTGEDKQVWIPPLLTSFYVFNADQVEGYEAPPLADIPAEQPATIVDGIAEAMGIKLVHTDLNRCFYRLSEDTSNTPPATQFKTIADYICANFHEFGHGTGHKSRLDRDLKNHFGDDAYAFEELVAELFAAMLAGQFGVSATPREDHVHYLKGWMRRIKEDEKALFKAVAAAQKAVDWANEAIEGASDEDALAEAA
jgi:antirestriction protein ArdC